MRGRGRCRGGPYGGIAVNGDFDYIVVGAGTAGCTVADRLSEDGRHRVLLIEAGGDDRHWMLQMPAGLRSVFRPSSRFNWWFETTPQPQLDGRRIAQPRGRVLGGSSSINGMTWLRGHPLDYDHWAGALGCRGWSFAECLPYFRRAESFDGPAGGWRGSDGPVGVRRQERLGPLDTAFLEACRQAGHVLVDDVNGRRQEGAGRFDMSVENGVRSSAARAHLHLRGPRRNLAIRLHTRVERLLIEGGRVTGVRQATRGMDAIDVRAAREVVLCAGVFATPQLLMRSGIGPGEHLRELGIQVMLDRPGVGANLHDHLEAHIQVETDRPVSLNRELRFHRMLWAGIQWFGFRRGVAAANQCHVGAFLRSDDGVPHPDLQIHFFPLFFGDDWIPDARTHGYRLGVGPMRPTSRGTVRLDPVDPAGMPLIDPNYRATEADRALTRAGIRLGRSILGQPAFRHYHRREAIPGEAVVSDADIDAFIRRDAASAYHPCGTCRMGADTDAVVDPELRLRGLDGLRVVDASAIPRIPSANINCPVFMIAEKAADLIRGRPPLEPEERVYHRAPATKGDSDRDQASGGRAVLQERITNTPDRS